MNKLKIANIELDSIVVLAPMAGVTNQAFKEIIRSSSDCLIYTEMVNDKALIHDNIRTKKMIEFSEMEHPLTMQLFGSDVETMVKAAVYLDQETDCDIIDINMGCPAPKIVKNMAGSRILLDSQLVYDILKNVVDNCQKPVTVKMRLGWDDEHINVVENAILAEKAGVSAIAIHGRTTKQQYTGKADWTWIKKVKEAVTIPVIGNGDIDSPEFAKEMLEYSKVDGLMIGRAAMGNPWIINEIDHYLKTGVKLEKPTTAQKVEMIRCHLDKLMRIKDERVAVLEMRGHGAWYLKGISGANKYKREFQTVQTYAEMINVINKIMEEL